MVLNKEETSTRGDEHMVRLLNEMIALMQGGQLEKADITRRYQITPRTFFRDMGIIGQVANENGMDLKPTNAKYQLEARIDVVHLVMIAHILLASGSFRKSEKDALLATLLSLLSPARRKEVKATLGAANVAEYSHNDHVDIIQIFRELSGAIANKMTVTFDYRSTRETSMNNAMHSHLGFPDCLFYDHGNFYCAMYEHGKVRGEKDHFAVYRLDRFGKIYHTRANKHLMPPQKFDLADFRKHAYLMSSGEAIDVEFDYRRYPNLVLDAFPTAHIGATSSQGTRVTISQVKFSSILLWVLSQGKNVAIIHPKELRDEVIKEAADVIGLYAKAETKGEATNVVDEG
ncbi:helix-turn-helix transcriptional regulator [Lacticaseibacillus sp. GG6-2]